MLFRSEDGVPRVSDRGIPRHAEHGRRAKEPFAEILQTCSLRNLREPMGGNLPNGFESQRSMSYLLERLFQIQKTHVERSEDELDSDHDDENRCDRKLGVEDVDVGQIVGELVNEDKRCDA